MKTTIFIDESGTLSDKSDKFIIIAALLSDNPESLNKILPKFRRNISKKGKNKKDKLVKEFKFHYVGNTTRRKVLDELYAKNIKVYVLAVDKMGRKISDTPENYAKLVQNLIKMIVKNENIGTIYLDKHFSNKTTSSKLQYYLEESFQKKIKFLQIDSLQDSRIDLADFVAGAMLRKYRMKDNLFSDIISKKIVKESLKPWNKLPEIIDKKI